MKKFRIFLVAMMAISVMALQAQKASVYEKEGERVKVTHYYDDGQVKEVGYFVDNKADGHWVEYRQDGSVKTKAYYKDGKKSGTWIVYSECGEFMYELVYADNRLQESHKWTIEERNLLANK